MDWEDDYLERSLEVANDRINGLEPSGNSPELVSAYINRGCILHMMEYKTSALEDFETALVMAGRIGFEDPGIMVKILTKMGCLTNEFGSDPIDYYRRAYRYLQLLDGSSRYFDRESIIEMAIDSARDLMECDAYDLALDFAECGIRLVGEGDDTWSLNRLSELNMVVGDVHCQMAYYSSAIVDLTKAIDTLRSLEPYGSLDDIDNLILAHVSRAKAYLGSGDVDRYIDDMNAAFDVLTSDMTPGDPERVSVLQDLEREMKRALIDHDRIDDAVERCAKNLKFIWPRPLRHRGTSGTTFGDPLHALIYIPMLGGSMQGLFCTKCKSLVPPGSSSCISCGGDLGDCMLSSQSCLTDIAPKRQTNAEILQRADPKAPFMPYKMRGSQQMMIDDILGALNEGKHIVMESGTGTGKTVTSLAAALEHARATNKKIIYLVRTISQGSQVMRELRAINRIQPVSGIVVSGRQKSCPLFRNVEGYDSIPSVVLSVMCDGRKQNSLKGFGGGCRFFDRCRTGLDGLERYVLENIPDSTDFDTYCETNGLCPYESRKVLMKSMDVIVVAYTQILTKDIRSSLLANMGLEEDYGRILLIIDEAHNFIDQARDAESFSITMKMLDAAIDECSTFRAPEVHPGVQLKTFLEYFKNSIRAVSTEKMGLGSNEMIIEGDFIEERIMSKFSMTRSEFDDAMERVISLGEARTEILMENKENRLSDVQVLGENMSNWCTSSSGRYIRSLRTDESGEVLTAFCMDPYETSLFLNSVRGAIHMSGTLAPMDQYARVLGLSGNPRFRTYPSPFPPENRKVVYIGDATTAAAKMKEDPTNKNRLEKYIADLCNAVDKNTLVFFTSYGNMAQMRPYLEARVLKSQYWEERGNSKRTMQKLDAFRNGRNGVFFTVMGGNIAEGIDFPGDELCFAIIVGIPFPPPDANNKAMQSVFDTRYNGKGFHYVSLIPAVRKMKQAIGRLIRTETDRGMAVILDNRMARYQSYLPCELVTDPAAVAARFFKD